MPRSLSRDRPDHQLVVETVEDAAACVAPAPGGQLLPVSSVHVCKVNTGTSQSGARKIEDLSLSVRACVRALAYAFVASLSFYLVVLVDK